MFLVDRRPGTREEARCQKRGRKRMAELAAVYDCAPAPREPAGIIAPPGADNKKRSPGPKTVGKWLTGSVADDIAAVISAGFDEAQRRDPHHRRQWIALADGSNAQIAAIAAEAARRGVTLPVICDFVHVLELSTVQARDCRILAGHFDVAIDGAWLRRCELAVPAEAGELAPELQVLAVSLFEGGAQGGGFVAVLFLKAGDLAGQGQDQRILAVIAGGLGLLGSCLGPQALDPGAQVGIAVEEGVGDAGFALHGRQGWPCVRCRANGHALDHDGD